MKFKFFNQPDISKCRDSSLSVGVCPQSGAMFPDFAYKRQDQTGLRPPVDKPYNAEGTRPLTPQPLLKN